MIPRFAAEKTLGRLTKWLRLLGFDTLYEIELSGKKFIETLGVGKNKGQYIFSIFLF